MNNEQCTNLEALLERLQCGLLLVVLCLNGLEFDELLAHVDVVLLNPIFHFRLELILSLNTNLLEHEPLPLQKYCTYSSTL